MASVFTVFVIAQEKANFTFTHNEESLSKCVINNLLKDDSWSKDEEVAELIAVRVAKIFRGTCKTKDKIRKSINNLVRYFRINRSHHPFQDRPEIFDSKLQLAARKALEDCAQREESSIEGNNRADDKEESILVPRYLVPFTPNAESLSECVLSNLLKDDTWDKDKEVAKFIADFVARIFRGTCRTKENISKKVSFLFYNLRNDILHHTFQSGEICGSKLTFAVKKL